LLRAVATEYALNARHEMASWRARGITGDELTRSLLGAPDVQRYQVVDRVLYRVRRADEPGKEWLHRGRQEFETMFRRLFLTPDCPCPDLDFVVNLGDYPVRRRPVLSTWVRDGDENPRLPSSAHWNSSTAGDDNDAAVRCHRLFTPEALKVPFVEREEKVVWRGSATGLYNTQVQRARRWAWLGVPWGSRVTRLRLVQQAAAHPDVLDAALTGFSHLSAENTAWLAQRYRTAEWVSQSWFLRHRYVVNVDGNVGTWSFLPLLGSGSVVLRQDTTYREFCDRQSRAHQLWVPVAADLADLIAQARWCLAHPRETDAIATDARAFVAHWLTGAAVDYYIAQLMAEYAQAFTGRVTRLAAAERVS
jgi:hypothetical protein